jgi:hypothetical protein
MRILIKTFLIFLIAYNNSYAFSEKEFHDNITDWEDVKIRLRNECIEIGAEDWLKIDNYCRFNIGSSSKDDLNKCKYNTALKFDDYYHGLNLCSLEAESKYPDELLNKKKLIDKKVQLDMKGTARFITKTEPSYSKSELIEARRTYISQCMTDKGWADPDNWQSKESKELQ